jgi:hypothetical protein
VPTAQEILERLQKIREGGGGAAEAEKTEKTVPAAAGQDAEIEKLRAEVERLRKTTLRGGLQDGYAPPDLEAYGRGGEMWESLVKTASQYEVTLADGVASMDDPNPGAILPRKGMAFTMALADLMKNCKLTDVDALTFAMSTNPGAFFPFNPTARDNYRQEEIRRMLAERGGA